MSHWQRVAFTVKSLLLILVLIVFLTRVIAPIMNVGETMAIGDSSSPFHGAWTFFQEISFWIIVPLFIGVVIAYLVFGSAQEELQKERRRRGL